MRSLLSIALLSVLFISHNVFAQYPSTSTLIADVKKKNPSEFVTVTPTGNWKMTHDKVPEYKAPDACEHPVDIIGKKKADGTYWTYHAIAIYNKVGGSMVFDRLFIVEDETRLNGINMPDKAFFMNTFKEKMNARDEKFMSGNFNLRKATNFYSYEVKGEPRATGNKEAIYVFATISVEYDVPSSNTKLSRRRSDVQLKYEKKGNDLVFLFSMRAPGDGEFLGERDFGDRDILRSIPNYESSTKTLEEFTSQNPDYPMAKGSNGEGYPMDDEIIKMAEETFLTKEDNFKVLFGEKGMNMITLVEFKEMDGSQPTMVDATHMNKAFYCDYTFFNAKDEEKKLTEYIGRRQLELQFEKDDKGWGIVGAKFLTETEYIKQTSLNYSSYINTVKAKTYAKKFGH